MEVKIAKEISKEYCSIIFTFQQIICKHIEHYEWEFNLIKPQIATLLPCIMLAISVSQRCQGSHSLSLMHKLKHIMRKNKGSNWCVYFQIALLTYNFIEEFSITPLYLEEQSLWEELICAFTIFLCVCVKKMVRVLLKIHQF